MTREPMPAMFSSISYISTSIQQSAVEDPRHLSYEAMDDEEEDDEDIADDKSDSSWTNGKDIFFSTPNYAISNPTFWIHVKRIYLKCFFFFQLSIFSYFLLLFPFYLFIS
jgi:hypothetical protein